MTSGRAIAEAALKVPLLAVGWRARVAGWFTKELGPETTAVLGVGAAVNGAGSADVTIYVGLRDASVEKIVEGATGSRKPTYQVRTWVTPLGYVLPESDYAAGKRVFNETNADALASELAALIVAHAEPELRRIAADPVLLTARVEANVVSGMGPAGMCRVAVLLTRTRGLDAAHAYVDERVAALGVQNNPAANEERDSRDVVLDAIRGI